MSNLVDQAQLQAILAALNITSGNDNLSPETHPAAPNNPDDEFEFGSAIDLVGDRRQNSVPWSWSNQGAATAVLTDGNLVLTAPASTTYDMRIVEQPTSGSTYKYRTKLTDIISDSVDFGYAGMVVRNAANDEFLSLHVRASTSGYRLEVCRWIAVDSVWSTQFASDDYPTLGRSVHSSIWFEIENDGTKLYFRYSNSGVDGTFINMYNELISLRLADVSNIGLFVNGKNSSPVIGIFDLFRLK